SPVATETVVTPPQPSAEASAAAHCLRIRSSISGESAKYFWRIPSIVVASCMHERSPISQIPTTPICSSYFFADPYRVGLPPPHRVSLGWGVRPRRGRGWILRNPCQHDRGLLVAVKVLAPTAP